MSGASARLAYTNDAGASLTSTMAIPVLTQIPGVMPVGFTTSAGETAFLYTLDQLGAFFQVGEDIIFNRVTVAFADSPYSVTATDYAMSVTTAGGAVTVTLPASTALTNGRMLAVYKMNSAATALTVAAGSGTTIGPSAAASVTITVQGTSLAIQYNSTTANWEFR